MNLLGQPELLVLFIPHMLFALSLHEASHAAAASWRGDDTASLLGRLTLNPLKHIDPFGLIAFFLIGFGWAKPVPVNPLRLRNFRRDHSLVALAGPASNLLSGIVLLGLIFFLYQLSGRPGGWSNDLMAFLLVGAQLHIGLCFFNLLPVPPLDGSHILLGLLPARVAEQLEFFFARGAIVLLALIVLASAFGLPIFRYLIWMPVNLIISGVLGEEVRTAAHWALNNFLSAGR